MVMAYCIEQPFHLISDMEACYTGTWLNDKVEGSYKIQIHHFIRKLNVIFPLSEHVHMQYMIEYNMAQEDKCI